MQDSFHDTLLQVPWQHCQPNDVTFQAVQLLLRRADGVAKLFVSHIVCVADWIGACVARPEPARLAFTHDVCLMLLEALSSQNLHDHNQAAVAAALKQPLAQMPADTKQLRNLTSWVEAHCSPRFMLAGRSPIRACLRLLRNLCGLQDGGNSSMGYDPSREEQHLLMTELMVRLLRQVIASASWTQLELNWNRLLNDAVHRTQPSLEQTAQHLIHCFSLFNELTMKPDLQEHLYMAAFAVLQSNTSAALSYLKAASAVIGDPNWCTTLCEMALQAFFTDRTFLVQGLRDFQAAVAFLHVPELPLQKFMDEAARQGHTLVLAGYLTRFVRADTPPEIAADITRSFVGSLSQVQYAAHNEYAVYYWRLLLSQLGAQFAVTSNPGRLERILVQLRDHFELVSYDSSLKSVLRRLLDTDSGYPYRMRCAARLLALTLSCCLVDGNNLRVPVQGQPLAPVSSWTKKALSDLEGILQGKVKVNYRSFSAVMTRAKQNAYGLEFQAAIAVCEATLQEMYAGEAWMLVK